MTGVLPSGHSYRELEGEELEAIKKKYLAYIDGAIFISPGNRYYPKAFLQFAERFYNFEVRETDVFVMAFPKSGINWVQEIVWNLINNPNLDNPEADISTDARCPFFDIDIYYSFSNYDFKPVGDLKEKFDRLCPGVKYNNGFFYNLAKFSPDPRLIKIHVLCSLLQPDVFRKAKVIYLARDPRDVAVSGYHYMKILKAYQFKETIDDYIDDFMNYKVYGCYWEHVKLGWEKRNHQNFLFLHYEDLKADAKGQIKKIDQFLGTKRSETQIDNVALCTSFDYMKEKMKDKQPTSFDDEAFIKDEVEKGGGFFRKGKVGSFKEDLPPHLQVKFNHWMKKNLAQFDDNFKYKSVL